MARPQTLNRGASDERAAIGAWLRRQRKVVSELYVLAPIQERAVHDFIERQLAWLFGGSVSDEKRQSSRVKRVIARKGGLRAK